MLDDFKKFLFRGNVVDLAVAVVIGAAFTAIVTAISTGIITPLIGMVVSKDFSRMTFEINGSTFNYGSVIDAVIRFVSVAAVVFFAIVKPMSVMAERRKRGSEDYRNAQGVMRDTLVRLVNEDYRTEIPQVRCRTTMVWGAHDTAATLPMAQEAQALFGQAELKVSESSGHLLDAALVALLREALA